jgi:predicted nucleotidyltransferase
MIEIAEGAGDEMIVALDQHHFDALVHHADVLGGDGAAVAAADHHDALAPTWASVRPPVRSSAGHCTDRAGAGTHQLEETSAIQSHVVFSLI